MGVANTRNPDDVQQRGVLRAALNALADLPYIKGLVYWVSFNTSGGGGFTQLFQTNSRTVLRPAIHILNEFYAKGRCTSRLPII
jgi:hypothetical protein